MKKIEAVIKPFMLDEVKMSYGIERKVIRMKKTTVFAVLMVLLLCGAYARAEEAAPSGGADVALLSQYVWRGYALSDSSLVIQPSISAGYKGFGLNLWGCFVICMNLVSFDVAPFGPSSTLSSDRRELMAEGRIVSLSNGRSTTSGVMVVKLKTDPHVPHVSQNLLRLMEVILLLPLINPSNQGREFFGFPIRG